MILQIMLPFIRIFRNASISYLIAFVLIIVIYNAHVISRHYTYWRNTGCHFTNATRLMHPYSTLCKMYFAPIWITTTWSGHSFAHVMTALLSWHEQHWSLTVSWWKIQRKTFAQDWNYEAISNLWNECIGMAWVLLEFLSIFDHWLIDCHPPIVVIKHRLIHCRHDLEIMREALLYCHVKTFRYYIIYPNSRK